MPEKLSVEVKLNNGNVFTKTKDLDFTTALYADTTPKLDGKMEGIWKLATALSENRKDKFYSSDKKPWGGVEDVSVVHRLMYDEDNLYMFVEVTDNIHNNQEDVSMLWAGDSIQIAMMEARNQGIDDTSSSFTEIAFGLSGDNELMYRHSSCGGQPVGEITNFDGVIVREGNKTVYEMRIPWSEIFDKEHKANKGDIYAYSLLVNDSDGQRTGVDNRHGFMNYNDGIGISKDSKLFGNMNLK